MMAQYEKDVTDTLKDMKDELGQVSYQLQSQTNVNTPGYFIFDNHYPDVDGFHTYDYEKNANSPSAITLDRIYPDSMYLGVNVVNPTSTLIICLTAYAFVMSYTNMQLLLETEDPTGARQTNFDWTGAGVTNKDLHNRVIISNGSPTVTLDFQTIGYFVYFNLAPGLWKFRPLIVADNKGATIRTEHIILSSEIF